MAPENTIPIKIVGMMPTENGVAVFVGNQEKIFSVHVDQGIAMTLALLLKGDKRERPLTHDLICLIFQTLGITVERILINDLRHDTYYARLTLRAENELHKKIIEIDARPSDCLALALETGKPILVARNVWDQVVDISELFHQLQTEAQVNPPKRNGKKKGTSSAGEETLE